MENNTNINFPNKLDSYKIQERIGSGSYGKIYKISLKDKGNNNFYALKQIELLNWKKNLYGKNEYLEKFKKKQIYYKN